MFSFSYKNKHMYQTHFLCFLNTKTRYLNYDTKHFFFFFFYKHKKTRFSTTIFKLYNQTGSMPLDFYFYFFVKHKMTKYN